VREAIQGRERRIARLGKFQDGRHATRLSTRCISEPLLVIRQVAKAEGHRDEIERSAGQRHCSASASNSRAGKRRLGQLAPAVNMGWQKSLPKTCPAASLGERRQQSPVPQHTSSTARPGRLQNFAHAAYVTARQWRSRLKER
jgi:hypothetical protein